MSNLGVYHSNPFNDSILNAAELTQYVICIVEEVQSFLSIFQQSVHKIHKLGLFRTLKLATPTLFLALQFLLKQRFNFSVASAQSNQKQHCFC